MRGKLAFDGETDKLTRITPAGAGKTASCVHRISMLRDHPRRCGENMMPRIFRSASQGSPPQVRGKPSRLAVPRLGIRITPAGAGKTRVAAVLSAAFQDHPRRCGENSSLTARNRISRGSPPQVRGKRRSLAANYHVDRDHPRRCGENGLFAAPALM